MNDMFPIESLESLPRQALLDLQCMIDVELERRADLDAAPEENTAAAGLVAA